MSSSNTLLLSYFFILFWNFKNNNLDKFSVDNYIKDKIKAFLSSDLMRDKLDFEMYKEYEFIYEED